MAFRGGGGGGVSPDTEFEALLPIGKIGPSDWGISFLSPETGDPDDGFFYFDWSVGHQFASGLGIGSGKLVPYSYVNGNDDASEGGYTLWLDDDYGLIAQARHDTANFTQRYMSLQVNAFLDQTWGGHDPFRVYLRQESGDPVAAFYVRPNGRMYDYAPDSAIHPAEMPAGGGLTRRWNDATKTLTITAKATNGDLYELELGPFTLVP